MSVKNAIENLKMEMKKEGILPEAGLGNDMFLFSSTLTPVVNVDLLITNPNQQILLAWRNAPHSGIGWHIPGGCVRLKETLEERIQKTAVAEIGTRLQYDKEPIKVFEIFSDGYRIGLEDQRERIHFITLVYQCRIPQDWEINEHAANPGEVGYLK